MGVSGPGRTTYVNDGRNLSSCPPRRLDVNVAAREGPAVLVQTEEAQRAFQESTMLIEILTGRVRALGEIGMLDLAVADPMDGQALAHMLAVHADRAREQADVLRQLSEQFEYLATIAKAAPAT